MARTKMTSPKGVAVWPWLNEPDTRWDTSEYKVSLKVYGKPAMEFAQQLEEFYKQGYTDFAKELKKPKLKKANMPWSEVVDDQGNLTGEIEFKFKNKSSYEYEKKTIENRIALIDRAGKIVESRIGSGSEIKIGFEPNVWWVPALGVGMTLRLKAVQVLELVEYGGGSSSGDFEFEFEDTTTTSTGSDDPFGF